MYKRPGGCEGADEIQGPEEGRVVSTQVVSKGQKDKVRDLRCHGLAALDTEFRFHFKPRVKLLEYFKLERDTT